MGALASCLVTVAALAAPHREGLGGPRSPDSPALAAKRTALREQVARGDFPGLVVGVVDHGRTPWLEAMGWADREVERPMTLDTPIPVASVSKALSGTVVARLAARGILDLDTPTDEVVPYAADADTALWPPVRLRELLSHRAGLPHFLWYECADVPASRLDRAAATPAFARGILPPGKEYHYSNASLDVALSVAERVSKRPLERLVAEELVAPLGLTATSIDGWVGDPGVAVGYDADRRPVRQRYRLRPLGGAGFLSSGGDLLRFAAFHLDGRGADGALLLDQTWLERIHAGRETSTPGLRYFAGWASFDLGGETILLSDGSMLGGAAVVLLAPRAKLGVILAANATTDRLLGLAFELLDSVLPGIAARFEVAVERLGGEIAQARPLPKGRFSGTIRVDQRTLPVEIESGGDVRAGVGGSRPAPLADPSWDHGALSGSVTGTLRGPGDATAGGGELLLTIWPGDGAIHGYMREERRFGSSACRSSLPYGFRLAPGGALTTAPLFHGANVVAAEQGER
jgi:CubicO group peptidase (beta-lactamase class C family)